MRTLAGILAVGIVAGTSFGAQAEPTQPIGFYLGAQAGANWLRDEDIDRAGSSFSPDFSVAPAISGNAGYNFGQFGPIGLRAEGEATFRRNNLESLNGAYAGGRVNSLGLFGNLLIDIPTGTALTPFIGAGIGGVHVDGSDIVTAGFGRVDDADWKLGYQGIAGLSYAVSEAVSLRGDYRYMQTNDATFTADNGDRVNVPNANHTVMIGVTYSFGAPAAPAPQPVAAVVAPPPPAPAPVVTQPSSYMVFFDFDRADLTDESRSIIARAAAAARNGQQVRVELTGHADRAGSDQYNLRLSQRRAEAVKAAMLQHGLPANAVATLAKGESNPLVATPDGVREPQNRRVEIMLP